MISKLEITPVIQKYREIIADFLKKQEEDRTNDFVPAALEVLEKPPSPFARFVLLLILLLAVILLVWSVFAKVDIVVTASGVVVPKGKVKLIQPMEGGRVTAIHVRDGQQVKQGEPLITMDSTDSQADVNSLQKELENIQLTAMRLQAQVAGDESIFSPSAEISSAEVDLQRKLLHESVLTEKAHDSARGSELSRNFAEKQSLQASVAKQERALPQLKLLHEKKRNMSKKGLIPEVEYIQSKMSLDEAIGNLESERGRLRAIEAQLAKSEQEKQFAEREIKRDLLTKLNETLNRQKTLKEELVKAKNKQNYRELRSPIDGFVQQLAINTIGGVITAAQTLMVIVPIDGGLEVEAKILNKDIGLISTGQDVSIKVVAYPYTKYGDIPGQIEWIAQDAVVNEQTGPIYPLRVSLSAIQLPRIVDNRPGAVSPGMTVTTDIKVGKRRVIEFFLAPILRYTHESLREH